MTAKPLTLVRNKGNKANSQARWKELMSNKKEKKGGAETKDDLQMLLTVFPNTRAQVPPVRLFYV
jgi:hypothetical protein